MRLVEFTDDVQEYLNSGMVFLQLNRSLFRPMLTDDGTPTEGEILMQDGDLFWWVIAGHSLIIRQTEDTTYELDVLAGEISDLEEIGEKLSRYN